MREIRPQMSSRIRGKLNSKKGLSIIFALMALLLAIMVSTVLVSAAYSNARRTQRTREQQQDHLMMDSAAKMVRDMVNGCTMTFSGTEVFYTEIKLAEGEEAAGAESTDEETDAGWTWSAFQVSKDNPVADLLADHVKYAIGASSGSEPDGEMEIVIQNADSLSGKKVIVELISPPFGLAGSDHDVEGLNYNLELRLTVRDGSGVSEYSNQMVLRANGKCASKYTVKESEMEPVSVSTTGETLTGRIRTEEVHQYEIKWGNVLITKGDFLTETVEESGEEPDD